MLRSCTVDDAVRICDIYNHYVLETVITFEESVVSPTEMAQRILDVTSRLPWLVWERDSEILGYAYASPWKVRSAYKNSVESTVYLAPTATGQGIGTKLYAALIADLRRRGLHCVVGGAALPNPASIALHEKMGFVKVAQFREIGFKHGRWVDVAYWELIL
jgi:L-amino acid N-acyltransferase YncA